MKENFKGLKIDTLSILAVEMNTDMNPNMTNTCYMSMLHAHVFAACPCP
jgi:hypothetical protein